MRRRRIAVAVVGVLLLAVVGALSYARPLLMTGTGYAAHNACAVTFVAGRGADAAAADLPDNPLVPFLRTEVSAEAGSATSTLLGFLFSQTAYYTDRSGCALGDPRPAITPPSRPVLAPNPAVPWPYGGKLPRPALSRAQATAVSRAVAAAFGATPAQARTLQTRAVVVVHHGDIVAERYAAGFTPQTRQLGWSMGKSVANMMAGRLVAQGKLRLTDDHLRPEWTDDRARITVDNLLHMSSGLSWDETYALGTPITRMLYLSPDMGGYAASLPLAHEPGSYQQYSSGTTNVLCQVLQQRSGLGPDMASRLVFEPLGMTSAVWEPDATGHPACSSYLWATPRDWAKFGQWALQGGSWNAQPLVPATWMTYSTSAVGTTSEENGLGAHWWTNRRKDGSLESPLVPADAFWASGHDGQRVVVVPSADLVVVRMGFTPSTVDLGAHRLVGELVTALG